MSPLDQSFFKAYSSESTIDTMQPAADLQKLEHPSSPVPPPHARFRPVRPKTLSNPGVAPVASPPAGKSPLAGKSPRASQPLPAAARTTVAVSNTAVLNKDPSDHSVAWTTSVRSDEASIGSASIEPETSLRPDAAELIESEDQIALSAALAFTGSDLFGDWDTALQAEQQIAVGDEVELPKDEDDSSQHNDEQPVSIPMPSRNSGITLRPELEVDRFAWATQVEKMTSLGEVTNLVDVLAETAATGDNVIALAGQQSGAGVSTLILVAARALASQGLRVVIVDANFQKPALATMLGIAPPEGWENVLAKNCSLSEVLIESLEDSFVLLPLVGSRIADVSFDDDAQATVAGMFGALRLDFDMVLIDAGARGEKTHNDSLLTSDATEILDIASGAIDAVVCVRDGRSEPLDDSVSSFVARPRRKSASLRQLGVVENFTL